MYKAIHADVQTYVSLGNVLTIKLYIVIMVSRLLIRGCGLRHLLSRSPCRSPAGFGMEISLLNIDGAAFCFVDIVLRKMDTVLGIAFSLLVNVYPLTSKFEKGPVVFAMSLFYIGVRIISAISTEEAVIGSLLT